jgi:hypothetical protein
MRLFLCFSLLIFIRSVVSFLFRCTPVYSGLHISNECYATSSQTDVETETQTVSTTGQVTTGKLRYLASALRYSSKRVKAIHDFSEVDEASLNTLSAGDIKTLIVASVELGSEAIISKLLRKLQSINRLNSQLLYVAIRQSCKKRSTLALFLLKESKDCAHPMDVDTINLVIEVLINKNKLSEAFELLREVNDNVYGNEIQCDASTFSMIIDSACRCQNPEILKSALELSRKQILSNSAIHKTRTLDSMNLASVGYAGMPLRPDYLAAIDRSLITNWLSICASNGDANSAIEVYMLYNKEFGVPDQKVLIFLLCSFLNTSKHGRERAVRTTDRQDGIQTCNVQVMDRIVDDLIDSDEDASHAVANLVFRYFCEFKRSIVDSQRYLQRIENRYSHRPSMLAISSYSELFYEVNKAAEGKEGNGESGSIGDSEQFHRYMVTGGYFPLHGREVKVSQAT